VGGKATKPNYLDDSEEEEEIEEKKPVVKKAAPTKAKVKKEPSVCH
jgi:hypothetical protein